MGFTHSLKCNSCSHLFDANIGGGFRFYQLRCTKCGKVHMIRFESIIDIQDKYSDKQAADDDSKFWKEIESTCPACPCGGFYKSDAPVRCPQCYSDNIKDLDYIVACYD